MLHQLYVNSLVRGYKSIRFLKAWGVLAFATFSPSTGWAFGPFGLGAASWGVSHGGGSFGLQGEEELRPQIARFSVIPRGIVPSHMRAQGRAFLLTSDPLLNLYEAGQITAEDALKRLIGARIGPELNIKVTRESQGTFLFTFFREGIPLCDTGVRGAALSGRTLTALGILPMLNGPQATQGHPWPDRESSELIAAEGLSSVSSSGPVEDRGDAQRCYAIDRGELHPVWQFLMQAGSDSYTVLADQDHVYGIESRSIHATSGRAKVYAYDPSSTPTLASETLANLSGDGTLSSEEFLTEVGGGAGRAFAANHVFDFDVTSDQFEETSAFVNASKHYKFLQSLGFQWYGPKPLKIRLRESSIGSNARFIPPFVSTMKPTIEIGINDGVHLQNLGTDAAVMSHELGHFAVFRSVTKITGEGFLLHEGLADFFETARGEDACVANSICVDGGLACVLPGKCLRTADNNLKYNDSQWRDWYRRAEGYIHLHSQVISGLLWDIRKVAKGGTKAFDQVVMAAVGLLPPAAGFEEFLVQLAVADRELAGGVHYAQITEHIEKRNLSAFFNGISDQGSVAPIDKEGVDGEGDSPDPSAGGSSTVRRKQKSSSCGTLAIQSSKPHISGYSRVPASYALFLDGVLGLVFALGGVWVMGIKAVVVKSKIVYKKIKK